MRREIRIITSYLKLVFLNVYFAFGIVLNIMGLMAVTYFEKVRIPNWVYFLIFILVLFISSYKVYRKQNLGVIFKKPKRENIIFGFPTDSHDVFNVKMKLYIFNSLNMPANVEQLKFRLIGVNDVYDKYILKNIVRLEEIEFTLKENVAPLPTSLRNKDEYLTCPFVVTKHEWMSFYINCRINLVGINKEIELFDWITVLHFKLGYRIESLNESDTKQICFSIEADSLKNIWNSNHL